MSFYYKPPIYGPRGLEKQWYNNIFHSHDLFCGCDSTIHHLLSLIASQTTPSDLPGTQELFKKCLPSTTTGITGTITATAGEKESEDDLGIDIGDLEKLFEEDGAGEELEG